MRVAVAERAVKGNQCEQFFHVLVDMRGVCELRESLHDRGLVAAAILFIRPAAV